MKRRLSEEQKKDWKRRLRFYIGAFIYDLFFKNMKISHRKFEVSWRGDKTTDYEVVVHFEMFYKGLPVLIELNEAEAYRLGNDLINITARNKERLQTEKENQ